MTDHQSGTRHRITSGLATALAAAVIVLALFPNAVSAADSPLTVTATSLVNIRSCPATICEVVTTAALGDELEPVGEPQDGFTPVQVDGGTGWVFSLFVQDPGADAPWFTAGEGDCQRVAFLFNIGVGYEPSQAVADTLVSKGVPATMFPMGDWAIEHPEYLQMLDRNHFVIGTHGDQAIMLPQVPDADVTMDLQSSIRSIESVIGRPIDEFVTPYAATTDERVRQLSIDLGLLPVGWDVTAGDFGDDATAALVYQRVMSSVQPGSIVEFHLDGSATGSSTAVALPRIIDELRSQGYEFVTVPQMMLPCQSAPVPSTPGTT